MATLLRKLRTQSFGRFFSTSSLTGFVFDLDGVLVKGKTLIPGADTAIQQLYDRDRQRVKFPVCFLTNGGGVTETKKAEQLSSLLNVRVDASQIVLCHTPMRSLASRFANVPVLIAGKMDVMAVAQSYGFTKAVSTQQLHNAMPSAAPFTLHEIAADCPVREKGYGTVKDPFRAVMVLTDPIDWARDLQLLTDVVTSHGIPGSRQTRTGDRSAQSVDVFIAHEDLVWANEFPLPRFGLGAFSVAFQSLFKAYTGKHPEITHFGKPTPAPFKLAEALLMQQGRRLGYQNPLNQIFMIGDNPAADVRGARNAGTPWIPVLVRTGVFHSTDTNSVQDPADFVATDVLEFIKSRLELLA